MTVVNPFVASDVARNYQTFRPRYHDLPFNMLREFLGAPFARSLDVACGTGHSTIALQKISDVVVGVDVSEAMIGEARQISTSEFVLAPAEAIPFSDGSFSLVNISMGIHWVDQEKFLREAWRTLAPGGHLSVDNYAFTGKMVPDNGFNEFNWDFYGKNFPPPKRYDNYPIDELTGRCGFRPAKDFAYEHCLAMLLENFVAFVLTQSNVLMANPDLGATERYLRKNYWPYFEGGEKQLQFGGLMKLYRKELV